MIFFREIQNDQTVPNHRETKSKVRKTTWHAAEAKRGKTKSQCDQ